MKPLAKLQLTQQELEDLASAVGYTLENYPAEGATEFKAELRNLKRKIWNEIGRRR